jgi:hypothetical protein
MNVLDEPSQTVPNSLAIGDMAAPQPATPNADVAAHSGGCLQDLVDLHQRLT